MDYTVPTKTLHASPGPAPPQGPSSEPKERITVAPQTDTPFHASQRWAYLQGLLAGIKPRDAIFLCGLALFEAFGYLLFESSTVLTSLGSLSPAAQSQFLTCALTGRTLTYALAFVVWRASHRQPKPIHLTLCAGALATLGFVVLRLSADLAIYAPATAALPWLALGGGALGSAGALANLLWARVSCTLLDLRQIYLFALLSNLASLVVYFVAVRVPSPAIFAVDALLFLGAIILGAVCLQRRETPARPSSPTTPASTPAPWKPVVAALWRPVLGTAILCFMGGLMLQMPHNQDLSLSQFQDTALLTQAVVMGALLAPVLLIRSQPNLGALFKVALPLSAAGFVLLPLVWSGGGIANACAQLGSGVASIILWCMVAHTVRDTDLTPTAPFACALLATSVAQLAGTAVGFAFQDSLAQGGMVLTGVALVAVYLVAMVSLFLFKDRGLRGSDPVAPIPAPDSDATNVAARCHNLARDHGLTPRETELLIQLAQGRTLRAISEKLTVSENTVKYHVKSIYQKLGVHTRDEIIDLVKQA